MFNIRVVTVDYYVSKPINELYKNTEKSIGKEWQEPVLRIFGATADGFKACVHVHGVYPYIYIPYKKGENPDRDALLVGAALDEALKTTLNSKIFRFVYKVTLVSGIPLYGYHSKHRQFLKIYFYNPYYIRKASELLLSGAILGQKLQPHEAHIPFTLQFMMDYNIYGMSFATFSGVKYRRNPENPGSLVGIREEDILPSKVKKITCSFFEVDALASDILNKIDQSAKGTNPGLRAIWEDERDRRRRQEKDSQVTVEESNFRGNIVMYPTEIVYKAQLAQKLSLISFQEPEITIVSDEPVHTYPAEVPENENYLEASRMEEGIEHYQYEEQQVNDVSSLIDEKILTQIAESQKEKANSESEGEEEEMEADSVLGRNQKAEEEAELENEEGVDMTQPLDLDEEVICGADDDRNEPRNSSTSDEDTFWRNMADKIFQLDGAGESSSESETEASPSGGFGSQVELSSAWSSNIMSILSEDSGCPTPSTVCQTPRTFWSNYSPNWLPQNQDSWGWNKSYTPFSDSGSKNQSDALSLSEFCRGGAKEGASEEPYDELFASNDGEYFQAAGVTPLCNAEPALSNPAAGLTPANGADGCDIILDSICESLHSASTKEEKLPLDSKSTDAKITFNRKPESDRQKFLHVLKSFAGRKVPSGENCGQLTLKQYIKDCKEIVSVDFKNLCNKEMIIIEYKSENKRSFQNKYLIKPLDKFLESWDSAERKAGDRVLPKEGGDAPKIVNGFNVEEGKNLRSVFNVLEKRFSDSSTVQSVRNKLTVKSMEILPDEVGGKDRCYNVNQNVISQGKIKMKLIKSQAENLEKNLVKGMLSEKRLRSDFKKIQAEKVKKVEEPKKNRGSCYCIRKSQKLGRREKGGKNFTEPDAKLINEINSSFEKYFKSIVQRKHFSNKNKRVIDVKQVELEEDDWEGEEEEEPAEERERNESSDEEKVGSVSASTKRCSQDVRALSSAESIKFVTRFLSTFSRMSDMPPLSITISLGNPRASVPVQVNLQPAAISSSEGKVRHYGKVQRKRMKVENVDGPDDELSSDDSTSGEAKPRVLGEKKAKRGSYYKPLNVVVCGSPSKKKAGRKKRKICEGPSKKKEKEDVRTKTGRKSVFDNSSKDRFGVCRENPTRRPPQGGNKEKISNQNLVKRGKNQRKSNNPFPRERVVSSESLELDFIDDSDEERKHKVESRPKTSFSSGLKRIPQADTEAFTSSEDDNFTIEKAGVLDRNIEKNEPLSGGCDDKSSLKLPEVEDAHPKSLPPVEGECDRIPHGMKTPDAGDCSRELQTPPQPGTSLSSADFSSEKLSLQPTISPLTLSGSPLFLSNSVPLESSSETLIHSEANFSTRTDESLRFSGREEFDSQNRFLNSSEWEGEEAEIGPPSLNWVIGSKIIRPKKKPLLRKDIFESEWHPGVFEGGEGAPFYGSPRDVAKAMVAGPRVLKVENRSVVGLKLFKSSLDISGTDERRNLLLKDPRAERCRLVQDGDVTITPLIKPPPLNSVLKWSCTSDAFGKDERKQEKTKKTIVKPLSPGEEMESDEELELSVTIRGFSGETRVSGSVDQENFPENHSQALELCETEWNSSKESSSEMKETKKLSLPKKSTDKADPLEMLENAPHQWSLSDKPVRSGGSKRDSENSFQIRGITLDNTFGFRQSVKNMQDLKPSDMHQYMTMLVMELHVQTRKDLVPDPCHDPIRALFYAITFDDPTKNQETGILVVGDQVMRGTAVSGHVIHYVPTEKELIQKILALVKVWDPEILAGYEIEMHSWGYLVQRGFILDMNLLTLLGRVQAEDLINKNYRDSNDSSDDAFDVPKIVRNMRISGRIVLDVWRLLRHEVALTSYTFENVMYHLSHERHPLLSYETLSRYWEHPTRRFRHVVVEHYITKVLGVIKVLEQLDFINRTSELSRLFGIQFYEVLSRGSQFRVESMMLRLAKPLNYVPASPSVAQRAAMRAPASLPLILEPESLFYSDPVIVLDFQSLYPSIIIAYNYCFSTCLGRVEKLGGCEPFEFGCSQLQVSPEELRRLGDDVSISPAGVAFVKSNVRKGVLPTMLEEILETRLMVKKSMKENKGNKTLEKILYARQLGLKLIANVTYGYTAANFSGRMPCIEVGDSVVSKGRETLHRAIELVKNTQKWGAKVVYGDTDSIFVCTPGKNRDEAFRIGAEIAEAVTQDNPKPVKLKLEKVYQPSILQTKKRYVGYMFESPEQEKPVFEAKGIETVRRDGCPAIGKVLEKALRILFDTRDVSLVKKYTIRQFAKLFQGRVNMQDLIFAKEYRGRKGYRPGACVPALQLAKQWTQYDKRAEPRLKERVPYVIVNGPPGVPLIRLVRSPVDLISDPSLHINAVYYITKALIPPMQRCFSLLGVDVTSWFFEMPRKYHKMYKWNCSEGQKRSTISQYFAVKECVVCSEVTNAPVCSECEKRPQVLVVRLSEKIRLLERCHEGLLEICRSCCKRPTELDCVSLDCPVFYRIKQSARALDQAPALREILNQYL